MISVKKHQRGRNGVENCRRQEVERILLSRDVSAMIRVERFMAEVKGRKREKYPQRDREKSEKKKRRREETERERGVTRDDGRPSHSKFPGGNKGPATSWSNYPIHLDWRAALVRRTNKCSTLPRGLALECLKPEQLYSNTIAIRRFKPNLCTFLILNPQQHNTPNTRNIKLPLITLKSLQKICLK